MNYFQEVQYIAQVDKDDNILGKVEKWEAHKKGILHRAFTLAIFYQDNVLLQHRKHPVFDSVFDITISSHQIFQGETLQSDKEAIYSTLKREWDINHNDLEQDISMNGTIYYRAQDPLSEYIEHEVCHIYSCTIKDIKLPNLNFAYGFSLLEIKSIKDKSHPLYKLLAPWVKQAFEDKLL